MGVQGRLIMAIEHAVERPEDFVDELAPGTKLLQGQYTIIEFINAGGFGITYLAKNSLDREVVIKECFPGSFCRRSQSAVSARSRAHENEFAQIVKLFVQEAKSLAKLIHPNIVGVHQVFEDNDTAYMAIDFIDGRDLLAIIESDRAALKPAQIVSMLKKLLGAVAFIHDNGMLHRDISPDNILVDKEGEPVLIDFGAARQQATRIGGKALSALRVVKDGYSPQEFYVSGSAQNASSDLYALAASFYHAITGEVPPGSQERLVAMAEKGGDPYRPLAGRVEGYPDGFLESIDTAISVLPRDRIQSARDWLERIGSKPELKVVPLGTRSEPVLDSKPVGGMRKSAAAAPAPGIANARPGDAPPAPAGSGARRAGSPAGAKAAVAAARPDGGGSRLVPRLIAVTITAGLAVYAYLQVSPQGAPGTPVIAVPQPGSAATSAEPEPAALPESALPESALPESKAPESDAPVSAVPVSAVPVSAAPPSAAPASAAPEAPSEAGAAPAAAEPVVALRQVAASGWEIELPFDIDASGRFPVIAAVRAAPELLAERPWIVEGTTIYMVNGIFVSDLASIESAIANSAAIGTEPFVVATLRVRTSPAEPVREETLPIPARRSIALVNGAEFRIEADGDRWRSSVARAVGAAGTGLRSGDILLAEHSAALPLDTVDGLEVLLDKLARENRPTAYFTVLRDGQQVAAEMPLAGRR